MLNLKKLYNTKSPILLEGETGTGKSVIAKKIHRNSENSNRKFIQINLATIREDLLESELFGHSKGAFTSALYNKKGYLDEVENGTLFLDEISELSLDAQKKLLLILEEKKYYPVGSCNEKFFSGRIIAASNKELKKIVALGGFRKDLFFRLNVFYYKIPPLREDEGNRKKLWNYYFDYYKKQLNKPLLKFSDEVEQLMSHYSWPGNIRELKNFMEYTVNISEEIIKQEDIPYWIHKSSNIQNVDLTFPKEEKISAFETVKSNFEKEFFTNALAAFQGRISFTAKKLQMSKTSLIYKIKKYKINTCQIRADFKDANMDYT
ncbi:MAG: sigma 54-interacting transcriptional regulator [Halobacteriovoraceae bacterium]|nr:sigma 54-interacting transcriptional regulator [Halobacteriovoraceae bacterium]